MSNLAGAISDIVNSRFLEIWALILLCTLSGSFAFVVSGRDALTHGPSPMSARPDAPLTCSPKFGPSMKDVPLSTFGDERVAVNHLFEHRGS